MTDSTPVSPKKPPLYSFSIGVGFCDVPLVPSSFFFERVVETVVFFKLYFIG
jgi:hypothetical protein